MMTFLDDHPSGKLCVMYQKQIEAIDEMSTESQRLYSFDPSKVTSHLLATFYTSATFR